MAKWLKTGFLHLIWAAVLLVSCNKNDFSEDDGDTAGEETSHSPDSLKYNPTWTYASHGSSYHDYKMVLPQDSVNRIEIIMTTQTWDKIRKNMITLYGFDFGKRPAGQPGGANLKNQEPAYVDVLLKFKGREWKNVGYRLKGNSSLNQAWTTGNYKLPFRMNFDRFEDSVKAIKNQHFYGFKELTFSCAFKDPSLIREKLASDVFRSAGIPASQTAFYRVFVNFGEGLKYCGLYTAVEIPDDNMVKSQFGEEEGNIYKPTSRLQFFNMAEFEKKNNEKLANYSDIQSFISILNSPLRKENPILWKSNLENSFDVNHFLKYLAVNNSIVNWDSYGIMAHNYYLYNHPQKKLTWIPWDHNEAFIGNPGITATVAQGQPPGPKSGLSLTMNEITNTWPLIRFLIDDTIYFRKYKDYMKAFDRDVFTTQKTSAMIDKYHTLISPYATGAEGEVPGYSYLQGSAAFINSRNELKNHIANRKLLISGF
jgi:hypothetical protein